MLVDRVAYRVFGGCGGRVQVRPHQQIQLISVHIFHIMHTQPIESALMCIQIALSTKKKIEKGKYLWG